MKIDADVKQWFELIGSGLGIILGLMSLIKPIRDWVIASIKNWWAARKAKKEMPGLIANINTKVNSMDDRLKAVEYEVKPNHGGSLKDAINLVKAEIDATNWLSPRPTFRTTSKGINTNVNESYCQLCGVGSEELMKLGWKSFVTDADQADDYYSRWLLAAKERSHFASKLKIQSSQGDNRGEWLIRLRPLGPFTTDAGDDDYLWQGCLYPSDSVAKAYANQYGIPV